MDHQPCEMNHDLDFLTFVQHNWIKPPVLSSWNNSDPIPIRWKFKLFNKV